MISSELTWVIPGVEASHLNEDTKVNITGSAQNRMKEVILENIVKIAAQNQENVLTLSLHLVRMDPVAVGILQTPKKDRIIVKR